MIATDAEAVLSHHATPLSRRDLDRKLCVTGFLQFCQSFSSAWILLNVNAKCQAPVFAERSAASRLCNFMGVDRGNILMMQKTGQPSAFAAIQYRRSDSTCAEWPG